MPPIKMRPQVLAGPRRKFDHSRGFSRFRISQLPAPRALTQASVAEPATALALCLEAKSDLQRVNSSSYELTSLREELARQLARIEATRELADLVTETTGPSRAGILRKAAPLLQSAEAVAIVPELAKLLGPDDQCHVLIPLLERDPGNSSVAEQIYESLQALQPSDSRVGALKYYARVLRTLPESEIGWRAADIQVEVDELAVTHPQIGLTARVDRN
jgi:hypothetical protein